MSIAALTMVWNDHWFLKRWIGYYGPLLGERSLYVVSHGPDETLREIIGAANLIEVPRDPTDINFDTRRWGFLSAYASALTRYHDAVICLDVDELLVPTQEGSTLTGVIEGFEGDATRCMPGFELFPSDDAADQVDLADRIAPHMAGAMFSPFYSKSGIALRPVEFFPGAHGMIGEEPEYCADLALFHLRYVNLAELARRNKVREEISEASVTDRKAFLDEGKPFATWRKADQITRRAFRGFKHAEEKSWAEILPHVENELDRLRVRRGDVFKFLNKKFAHVRAPLPDWMQELF